MGNNINITPESIDEILEKKENKKQQEETPQKENIFDTKNYLNTRLDAKKGETSKEIKIRLLPVDATGTPFKIVHMHTLHTNNKRISESGFKNYLCLKKTEGIDKNQYGDKCPFCEAADVAWKKYKEETDEALKATYLDEFKANCSSEYAIIRCIERGHEDEGPKFWKVRVRSDKEDAMNKIIKLYQERRKESIEVEYGEDFLKEPKEKQEVKFKEDGFVPTNILDVNNGKDIKITIEAVYDKAGKLTNKTSLNVTDYGNPRPIDKNPEQINIWLNDSKTWDKVFTPKPYEYLEIVINGGSPYYVKNENKWVAWDDNFKSNKEKSEEEANAAIEQSAAQATQQVVNNTTTFTPPVQQAPINVRMQETDASDLPF